MLGPRLRQVRKKRRLTLADVSKSTGISVSFLSDIERGRTKPSLESLDKLADLYGMTMSELLEGVGKVAAQKCNRIHREGWDEFVERNPDIPEHERELLLSVESRARQRARTADDWSRVYWSLMNIIR